MTDISFLAGGGEAGALMRAADWGATPLGAPEGWPSELRTLVALMLASGQPMFVAWGAARTLLHNDAYIPLLGRKHPGAMGRPFLDVWAEARQDLLPLYEAVFAGRPIQGDIALRLDRRGVLEEAHFAFSYTPVRVGGGEVTGLFCACTETTSAVQQRHSAEQNRRRLAQMFDQGPSFMALLEGPEHRIELANAGYFRLVGGRDVIGRTVAEALPDAAAQGFVALLDEVFATGRAFRSTGMRYAVQATAGGAVDERFVDFIYQPLTDAAGQVTGIFVEGADITERAVADAALRRSEEQLRLATENGEIGLWDVDVATGALYWPARVKAMFGISPDVPVCMADFYAGLHPEDREHTAGAYARAADPAVRALYDAEYRTVGAEDGVVRWVAAKGRGVFDEAGRCVRMIGTAQDITARKRVEAQLRVLNATLEQQVVERSRERALTWQITPYLLAVMSTDGVFESLNPAWSVQLGWSPEELVGQSCTRFLHPDDHEASRRALLSLASGRPLLDFENRYRAADGAYRWLSWVAIPSDGKVYGTARDVTVVKAQAAALADRTAERELIWRNAQDLLVAIDPAGVFLDVSHAATKILDWAPEEMVGRSVFDFIHPDDEAATRDALAHATGEALPTFVNRYRHRDGTYRWLSWVAAPEGGLIYATARHVTLERAQAQALAEAQEALRQSQKMEAIGQLTGGIAHDFNNLLAGISGSLELLEGRLAEGRLGGAERYIGAAQGSARRAAALTQRLLAFSRRQTLDPRPTDVNRLVAGVEELIRRTVGPAVTLEVVGAVGLWTTLVDTSQLENALLNLCINARDAMPDGGRITIETANRRLDDRTAGARALPAGQYISLSVTDTGTGMAADVVEHAFDPFFTTKPLGQGTGLGLSMVHGFVRQSGGQVRIHTAPGRGTTMSLYLPRFAGAAEDARPVAEVGAPEPGRGETVLVIDDEATVRMLMVEVLEDAGYATLEAGDGPAGLEILRSETRIDLLVTDVGLPGGMNGRQVADAARATRPDLRVLFVTGYAENAAVGHGHLDPGMAVITKPFGMVALGNKVREMIEAA